MSIVLTPRDRGLLEALTRHVRIMSLGQATRLLQHLSESSSPTSRTLRHRIERLTSSGWLEMYQVNAHRLESTERPLAVWTPNRLAPNADVIARQTQTRWQTGCVVVTVCVASARAANVFGSTSSGLPRREQLDHDLLLSQVYLRYRTNKRIRRDTWVGEHCLPKAGYRIKDPDAFLIDARGRVTRVIESAGRYSVSQIEDLHDYCADRGYSYELW